MQHRETGSVPGAPQSQRPSLSTYIQVALDEHISTNLLVPKQRRRRRKNQQNDPLKSSLPALSAVSTPPPAPIKRRQPKRKSRCKNAVLWSRDSFNRREFIVRNLVTSQDLEDEDEAEEVKEEVIGDFKRFGELRDLTIIKENIDGGEVGDVVIVFKDAENAKVAFNAFNGKVFGGKTVECKWVVKAAIVRGMVMAEELEDPDEAADVEEEVMQVLTKHGAVKELQVNKTTGEVTVSFCEEDSAEKLVAAIDRSQYGGRLVTASLVESAIAVESAKSSIEKEAKQCIAQATESTDMQEVVKMFLKRLASLQERAHIQNPQHDKRSRRVVLGMHEVRRGLLGNKVRLLIIAHDLEACGLLDDNISELMEIATKQEVPVISPMNRRKLGRALMKSVRVSCIGVYSVEGANDLFQQILTMMRTTAHRKMG